MPEADDAPAGTTANPFAPMKVSGGALTPLLSELAQAG